MEIDAELRHVQGIVPGSRPDLVKFPECLAPQSSSQEGLPSLEVKAVRHGDRQGELLGVRGHLGPLLQPGQDLGPRLGGIPGRRLDGRRDQPGDRQRIARPDLLNAQGIVGIRVGVEELLPEIVRRLRLGLGLQLAQPVEALGTVR